MVNKLKELGSRLLGRRRQDQKSLEQALQTLERPPTEFGFLQGEKGKEHLSKMLEEMERLPYDRFRLKRYDGTVRNVGPMQFPYQLIHEILSVNLGDVCYVDLTCTFELDREGNACNESYSFKARYMVNETDGDMGDQLCGFITGERARILYRRFIEHVSSMKEPDI